MNYFISKVNTALSGSSQSGFATAQQRVADFVDGRRDVAGYSHHFNFYRQNPTTTPEEAAEKKLVMSALERAHDWARWRGHFLAPPPSGVI